MLRITPRLSGTHWLPWLALICLSFVVFLGKAYETSLAPNDSALFGIVAMKVTDQGLLPHLPIQGVANYDGASQVGFNDLPFFFPYLNGLAMRLLGPSAWGSRVLPAILAVGTVLLTGILGWILESEIFGFSAALLLTLTPEYIKMGANFHLDLPMIFFILLSFVAWLRGFPIAAGIAAAIGTWVKTPVALLIVPTSLAVMMVQGEWRQKLGPWFRLTLSAVAAIALFWIFVGYRGGFALVEDYWGRQVLGTALRGRGMVAQTDWFMFLNYFLRHYLPWNLLLIASLGVIAYRKLWQKPVVLWALSGCLILVGAISPLKFKYDYYFLPVFPFLSLLAMPLFGGSLEKYRLKIFSGATVFSLGLLTLLLCTPIALSPEAFPSFKRFSAIIQNYGNCSDEILFVEGGTPYGGRQEYGIEARFYTGRTLSGASCEKATLAAGDPKIRWLIASGENVQKCLSGEARALFPSAFKFGNQRLLSKTNLSVNGLSDLTPLERELTAVTDCRSKIFPQDRYHAYLPGE